MKKKIAVVVIVMLALSFTAFFTPEIQAETELQKTQKKIDQLKKDQNNLKKAANNSEANLKNIRNDIKKTTNEINNLDLQIYETENKIESKEQDIAVTEEKAADAAQLLDEAIARVAARDDLLKTRVRAMYETGEVSYLEVLLDSQSIGDFLTRMDMVEKIVDQDKTILAENIADKEEIEIRKNEIEEYLAQLVVEHNDLSELKATLAGQRKSMTAYVASLADKEDEVEKLLEEQGKELAKIANDISKENAKLEKLMYDGGYFAWPVPGHTRITSGFGTRTDPITKVKNVTHNGNDIGAPQGTNIVAGADGKVILAELYGSYGNCVMIDHGSGYVTLYAHIRNGGIKVKVGDYVSRGQKIAEVGSTGRSTGPHLHFSVIKDGVFVDSLKYLKGN